MKHIAAYLLSVLSGNENPSVDDVRAILDAAGVEVDEDSLGSLVTDLHGKQIHEVIAAGQSKFSSAPVGFVGGSGSSGAAPTGSGGPTAVAAAEEPEEEEEEEARQTFYIYKIMKLTSNAHPSLFLFFFFPSGPWILSL